MINALEASKKTHDAIMKHRQIMMEKANNFAETVCNEKILRASENRAYHVTVELHKNEKEFAKEIRAILADNGYGVTVEKFQDSQGSYYLVTIEWASADKDG
jgi:hypothetical protein